MVNSLQHRLAHYLALTLAWAAIALPNLGAPSLWDIDEGLNAEAAREMLESGNYVVPRFNFQLRDAKPGLLYWLQVAAYRVFGVNEFAARLPSGIATLIAALAVYELGRSMFSRVTGLVGAIGLLSCLLVGGISHVANPDALLLACTCLTFLAFWTGFAPRRPGDQPRRAWFVPFGIACGLGMLAKGPVALALPGLIVLVFLAWQRQLRCLWDRRLILGACVFAAVALPWYAMVTIETRGAFFRGFFITNNVERFVSPNNNHRGALYYHPLVLLAGFAPWSVFILPAAWYAVRGCRRRLVDDFRPEGDRPLAANRLLVCWFVAYMLFFTGAATKLPGYTLPLYPAVALLTARFLDGWRRGELRVPQWLMANAAACLMLLGLGVTAGLLLIGGGSVPSVRSIEALRNLAWIGAIPLIGGATALALHRRRGAALAALCAAAVPFIAAVFVLGPPVFNSEKSSRELVTTSSAHRRDQDLRLGGFRYFQPSLVFYSEREVLLLPNDDVTVEFLSCPTPALAFMPRAEWERLSDRVSGRVVASQWDMYRRCEIVAVSNEGITPPAAPLARR